MIDLPAYPPPAEAEPAFIDFGAFLTPPLGGPVQRVERMGSRFGISVSMPTMRAPQLGRQWVSALIRGKQEGARMPFPLQGFDPGSPGAIVVDGAGQSGRSLAVRGGTPNYVVRDGQFFSIENGGQHYLHMHAGEVILDAAGEGTLAIEPMLRISPDDGAECHFGKPMIEGFIMGEEWRWRMSIARLVGMDFMLLERE